MIIKIGDFVRHRKDQTNDLYVVKDIRTVIAGPKKFITCSYVGLNHGGSGHQNINDMVKIVTTQDEANLVRLLFA